MTISITPGIRDEEKIAEIKAARETLNGEAWEEYCYNRVCDGEDWLDALYYASDDGDAVLEKWGRYFLDCLLDDEKYYYVADMGGLEY